jgi:hypothetical protein
MPGDPKNPEIGELSIDATVCQPYIVDLPAGGLVGLRTEHEGVDDVIDEIAANQAAWGDKAGVTAGDFNQIMTSTQHIEEIDRHLPAARKLVELLEETRAKEVDARERSISSVAQTVEIRAKQPGNEAVLAKYDATRAYRSEFANKAARTRRKNAEEKTAKRVPNKPTKPDAPADGGNEGGG